jgi:nitrate reductase alpha subunit
MDINYYGTIGSNRDEFVVIPQAQKSRMNDEGSDEN